jgi:hypothetical protein
MSQKLAEQKSSKWVYATIRLYDSQRILSPTHLSFDRVIFRNPPKLTTTQVEIVVSNGDDEFRSLASVLPHDPNALEIPIQLISEQKAPAKLTA